eukprot:m.240223 g.240223  ORF g.240223 m.240223 type:complete len:51 (-) comp14679_c0_seq1:356-508(-)
MCFTNKKEINEIIKKLLTTTTTIEENKFPVPPLLTQMHWLMHAMQLCTPQ